MHGAILPLKGCCAFFGEENAKEIRGMSFDINSHYSGNYRYYIPQPPSNTAFAPLKIVKMFFEILEKIVKWGDYTLGKEIKSPFAYDTF